MQKRILHSVSLNGMTARLPYLREPDGEKLPVVCSFTGEPQKAVIPAAFAGAETMNTDQCGTLYGTSEPFGAAALKK